MKSKKKKIKFINCHVDNSKKVFAPRTETEFWVKEAIKTLKRAKKPFYVLDIFAGTGCIGISVLRAIKNIKVDFVDIDNKAVEQIRLNLKLNRISSDRYKIYKSDLFEKLEGRKPEFFKNEVSGAEYDFIFANPPYVALDRISEVQKEIIEKEPKTALFAGKDGMVLIYKFLVRVKKYLKPNGIIFMEFDPLQKEKIKKIMINENFKAEFKKDQFDKYRWLKAHIK
ncbi:N5-glutamine methyltransferase family protein [Patescibacteria group bacterium]